MLVYKNILFLFGILGLIFIIIDVVRTYYKCPPERTIYRFIPRTFKEEQENPVPLDDLFKVMFEQPSPWVHTFDIYKSKKDINDDFISQG
jgi:hypothetical protein